MGIGHAISPGKGEGHQIKWKPPFPTRLLPTSPDNWGAPLQAQKRRKKRRVKQFFFGRGKY